MLAVCICVTGCSEPPTASSPTPTLLEAVNGFSILGLESDLGRRPRVISRAEADPTQWRVQTLMEAHLRDGHTGKASTGSVARLFRSYARFEETGLPAQRVELAAAIQALAPEAKKDPLVEFLALQHSPRDTNETARIIRLLQLHDAILQSDHHPLERFQAGLQVLTRLKAARPEIHFLARCAPVTTDLQQAIGDTNAPPALLFTSARHWLKLLRDVPWHDQVKAQLLPVLEAHWAETELYYTFQGEVNFVTAWDWRGGGYRSSVARQRSREFARHINLAQQALEQAWRISPANPRTALLMMEVELAQGRGRGRMENWFDRAMNLDPNYYEAAKLMSFYLEPRWRGTEEETLEFARSCVQSEVWGGRVPLVLPRLHQSLAAYHLLPTSPQYWTQPHVWPDVKSGFEKFFALNPDAREEHLEFAGLAFFCQQYSVFLKETEAFPEFELAEHFGGAARLREMKQTASTTPDLSGEAAEKLFAEKPFAPATIVSPLQEAASRINDLPLVENPEERPVITSRPATNPFDWIVQIMNEGYRRTADASSAWDDQVGAVYAAYARRYLTNSPANHEALVQAITRLDGYEGTDPMVRYLRVNYSEQWATNTWRAWAAELLAAHDTALRGDYPHWVRFRIGRSAIRAVERADSMVRFFPRTKQVTAAIQDMARDPNAPPEEVVKAASLWFHAGNQQVWYDYVGEVVLPVIEKHQGQTDSWYQLVGDTETTLAWKDRGTAFIGDVKPEQQQKFAEHLAKAEAALTAGWNINPANVEIARFMMTVELGQGRGRSRMELWFDRVMTLDPNRADAVNQMLEYLHPKWYGSAAACLEFARRSARNDSWGGKTPLVLARVHDMLAGYSGLGESPDYWHRDEVWEDVRFASEKYLSAHPDDHAERLQYALRAHRCGQYARFQELVELAGPITDYSRLGGKEKFEEMVRTARAASQKE
jgi:hypothetical protein